jgi:alpha-aminoadipic semialdehyde synthase
MVMKTFLIRAEDKNQWERRSTITPYSLKVILQETSATAYIEDSTKRYYPKHEFIAAGAQIFSDRNCGDVIFGVKEIPEEKILKDKIYLFFSHTIKGQKENMPMLKKIINSNSTLIDYEKIEDEKGRRKVFFGPYAGDAGAIDIFWLLGENLNKKGIKTPFSKCKQALHYHSLTDAKNQFNAIGKELQKDGLPKELSPFVVGIMGYGNVSKGAQNILNEFPVEYIEPSELSSLKSSAAVSNKKIYGVVFKEVHMVKHMENQSFNLQEYYTYPERYHPDFAKYLPHLSILINATFWEKKYPKFVTWQNLKDLNETQTPPKLRAIADITCDVGGSIECNVKSTDSGMPAYLVNAKRSTTKDGHFGNGIILLAVDNLPAELPKDASDFFSRKLTPYIPSILNADYSGALKNSGLHADIQNAVIVYNGQLTAKYQYLEKFL